MRHAQARGCTATPDRGNSGECFAKPAGRRSHLDSLFAVRRLRTQVDRPKMPCSKLPGNSSRLADNQPEPTEPKERARTAATTATSQVSDRKSHAETCRKFQANK